MTNTAELQCATMLTGWISQAYERLPRKRVGKGREKTRLWRGGNTHPLIWHCWNYQYMFRLWWSPGNRVNMICSLTPKLLLIRILRNFRPISQLRLIDKKVFLVGHTGGIVIGCPPWGRGGRGELPAGSAPVGKFCVYHAPSCVHHHRLSRPLLRQEECLK